MIIVVVCFSKENVRLLLFIPKLIDSLSADTARPRCSNNEVDDEQPLQVSWTQGLWIEHFRQGPLADSNHQGE